MLEWGSKQWRTEREIPESFTWVNYQSMKNVFLYFHSLRIDLRRMNYIDFLKVLVRRENFEQCI